MGFDRLDGIREYGITMKLSFGINDRVARVQGLLGRGFTQAWCGGARLRGIAMCQSSIFRLARFGGATAIAAGVLIGLDGCQTKPRSSEQSDVPSPATFSQVPQAGTTTNHQKLAEAMRATDHSVTSQAGTGTNQQRGVTSEPLVLREGDTVRISFPGSPNLNTVQQIRRDGKVSLALVGEFHAVGLTPVQMEKELVKLYASQLVTKEVTVTLESSAFMVYVTGAVSRSGRLVSDRPMTALEAVLDAGVDYGKANLKSVTVRRRENGHTKIYNLNLKKALQGTGGGEFYLKPQDIIFVRERFTWF
jgi:polysaccharide export outer membrane protein